MRKFILSFLFVFYVVFCNAQYSHLWTQAMGDTNTNYGPYSTIDSSGNTILFFETFYDFDIDPDTGTIVNMGLLNNPNCEDDVLIKYDSAGNYLWHRVFSFYNTSVIYSIKTDVNGNILIAGYFSHNAILEDGLGSYDTIISSNGGNDMNVIFFKYSPSGTLLFAKNLETSGTTLDGMTVDKNNNFFLYGEFYGGYMDFDPGTGQAIVNSLGKVPAFFAKYSDTGQLLFYKILMPVNSLSLIYPIDLRIDNSDNIVITGPIDGGADLGGVIVGSGQYFAKFDSSGNYIWHKLLTGDDNFINCLKTDKQNNIYLSGFIRTTPIDIDPGPGSYVIQPNGDNEALFVKYDSLGNFLWGHGFGSSSSDFSGDFEIDTSGNIFIAAGFGSNLIGNPSWGLPSLPPGNALLKTDNNGYLISSKTLPYWGIGKLELYKNDFLFMQGGFNFSADFDLSTGVFSQTSNGSSDIYFSKYQLKDEHYLISGKIYSDQNNDSVFNAGDTPLENAIVNVNPGNYFASSNANGDYYCYVPQGNYTITIPTFPPHYLSSYPVSDTAVFISNQVDTANNFALNPDHNAQDLKINITNVSLLRPGFASGFVLTASNIGNGPLPCSVTCNYPSTLIYNNSYPVADTILPNYLEWNVDTLLPTHSTNLYSEFVVDSFSVNLGDTVTIKCDIFPYINDLDQSNNKDELSLIAVESFDPNYKEVYPSTNLEPLQADTTLLKYTIHFQNTGTDTALTISIIDTLSSLLDISTFTLEASSHPCTINISENGIAEFNFYNIHLPDSGTNFIGSCGFIKYSIRPLQGLTNGQVIENMAHIVFDFNVPVTTNNVQTFIGVTGIQDAEFHSEILIYPNPAADFITVKNITSQPFTISIKDIFGKTVMQKKSSDEKIVLNLGKFSAGVYLLIVETKKETMIKKLIKQ